MSALSLQRNTRCKNPARVSFGSIPENNILSHLESCLVHELTDQLHNHLLLVYRILRINYFTFE